MRMRRAVSFALLLALLAAAATFLIRPLWLNQREYGHWRDRAVRTVAEYQALFAKQSELQAALKALQQQPLWNQLYVAKDSKSATSLIEQDAQALLRQSGLTSAVDAEADVAHSVTVRCAFTTTIDRLEALLQALDSHAQLLDVSALQVDAPLQQDRGSNAPLSVHLTLRGYWRAQSAA